MIARFLLVAGPDDALEHDMIARRIAEVAGPYRLATLLNRDSLRLLANDAAPPLPLGGERGAILGTLFRKHPLGARVGALDPHEADRIVASDGSVLADDYWGNYVAVIAGKGRSVTVARAPFGGLAAYAMQAGALTVIASHLDMLLAAAGRLAVIDWAAIARHLIAPNLKSPRTCIEGVTEIIGGFRLTIGDGRHEPDPFWSPWPFTLEQARIADTEDAVARVRSVTSDCVAALAGDAGHAVLGISGGLDSSIVAACLAQAGAPFSCVTLYSRDASGDERSYARTLADHLGARLFEESETVDRVDVTRSDSAHLPRPIARAFAQSGDRSNLAVAAKVGADSFISGGGGDNVFCYLQSAAPVADRLLADGPGLDALRTARDISRLADCSLWAALKSGVERAYLRERHYRWKPEPSLLNEITSDLCAEACTPIWSDVPEAVLPGSSNHVAWLVGTQNHIEGFHRERTHPTLWPLLAQPLVELCLRIPSWMWCAGGHNRMIARRAFADLLPASIIERRSKGTPDSFVVELFEHNRSRLRDLLADGLLAAHGLIDASEIVRQLGDLRPVLGLGYWRIMTLADVEAWLRAVKAEYPAASPASAHIAPLLPDRDR